MAHPISTNLARILDLKNSDLDSEVDLKLLAENVAETFGDKSDKAKALLATAGGHVRLVELGRHLLKLIEVDSTVRDIQTTGHLAKLISRLDVFHQTKKYEIIGMPNVLFDSASQAERRAFFENGGLLQIDGSLLALPEVKDMLNREARILAS